MKKLFLIAAVLVIAVSCKKLEKEPLGPTDIRIRNLESVSMTDLTVNTGGGEYNYGTLEALDTTGYHRFDKAYQKANITAFINGQKYKTDTAIYNMGMIYLGQSKITFKLSIADPVLKKLEMQIIYDSPLK